MKLFSIENKSSKRTITIFGIKFSFKNKKIAELENKINCLESFLIAILDNQETNSNIDFLSDLLKKDVQGLDFWKNINPEICFKTLSFLIRQNFKNEAEKLFDILNEIYKVEDYINYLPIANYAYEKGIKTVELEKSAFVYKNFKKNNDDNLFLNYLENKTIAIVGNSGHEIGTNNGEKIDSYDVVIRFGNYPKGYEKDYGKKTNVWFRTLGLANIDRENIDEYDFIMWGIDIELNPLYNNRLDILYRDFKKYPEKIIYMPKKWYKDILYLNCLNKKPTSGFVMIYSIINSKKPKKVDVFGFSFLDENSSDNSHYYNDNSRLEIDHDMENERKFLREFYLEYKNREAE